VKRNVQETDELKEIKFEGKKLWVFMKASRCLLSKAKGLGNFLMLGYTFFFFPLLGFELRIYTLSHSTSLFLQCFFF
jgi:hypothetical protein